MVKIYLLILFIMCSKGWASEYPDPRAWVEKVPEKTWLGTTGLIRNVCIVSEIEGAIKKWEQTMLDFSSLAFLQYIDAQSKQFASRLNPKKVLDSQSLEIALGLMGAHLVLRDEGQQMIAQVPGKAGLRNLANWPIGEDDKQSSEKMLAWIVRNIGYDAIVLDKQNSLLLVALLTPNNELGQGILIQKSKRQWVLKPEKIRGEALLQMVRVEGHLAVFEILLQNRSKYRFEPGSKVILGQNRNIEKLIKTIDPIQPK